MVVGPFFCHVGKRKVGDVSYFGYKFGDQQVGPLTPTCCFVSLSGIS